MRPQKTPPLRLRPGRASSAGNGGKARRAGNAAADKPANSAGDSRGGRDRRPLRQREGRPLPRPAGPTYAGNITAEDTAWAADKLARAAAKLTGWGQQVDPDSFAIGPSFIRLNVRPRGSKTSFKRVCDRAADLKTHLGLDMEPIIESHSYFFTIDVQRPHRQVVTLEQALSQAPGRQGA